MVTMVQKIKHNFMKKNNFYVLIFLLSLVMVSLSYAKDNSEFTPSLGIELGYSDNIDQTYTDEKGSFIDIGTPSDLQYASEYLKDY